MAAFRFIYEPSEFGRIIPACIIDARASIPAIKNQIGVVIKAYTDAEVEKVQSDILFFRIETINTGAGTSDGVLAGYFSISVKGNGITAGLYQFQLRSSFMVYSTQISNEIGNFISSNEWKQYYL